MSRSSPSQTVPAPESEGDHQSGRRRLAYDELLLLQLGVHMKRAHLRRTLTAPPLRHDDAIDARIRARLRLLSVCCSNARRTVVAMSLSSGHHPGGYQYLLFELRSELPRGPRGDHHVRSAGSRAVRNEGRRAVLRGPIGPCRSTLVNVYDPVRVPTCIVKLT